MNKLIAIIIFLLILIGAGFIYLKISHKSSNIEILSDADETIQPPQPVKVTQDEINQLPKDTSALGGYNVLIADRGNNRLVEVNPDKQIIWEYDFHLPRLGLGADDAFFTDNGQSIIVNLEEYHLIEIIDYATKTIKWTYGNAGVPGHLDGQLHTPDDAYRLANGDVIVADIKNCRVIEIAPDKHIVRQYGTTRICDNKPGHLNEPNGDTPLPNGHVLISNIRSRDLVELDQNWQPIFSMNLPVKYPSDPQMTQAGNILISDYSKPGQIVEISKKNQIVWQYGGDSTARLDRPSLAIELPNGNILANDDFNHRVIVIDKQTKQIIWQYGVTGKPGKGADQLSIPDGLDIIKNSDPMLNTIGAVTRHAQNFVNQQVRVQGYLLKRENGYDIFSDEPTGALGSFDLPVIGTGLDTVDFNQEYILQGSFTSGGFNSINGNPNHLELSVPPQVVQ